MISNKPDTVASENPYDFFVQWHLTERCNLSCAHCYQEGTAAREIGFQEIRKVLRETSDTIRLWSDMYEILFAVSFQVTGGEPFLREDLLPILREIARSGFGVYLLTNGTLIDSEWSRALADIPVKGVQVSIEGPEAIHEAIRGRGSFASALRGTRCLLDAGTEVTLNVTLSEVNAGNLPDIFSLAKDAGVQRLGFSRLVPHGRGSAMLPAMLEKDKLREAYEQILSTNIPGLGIVTGDPVASQLHYGVDGDEALPFPVGGCAAGVSGITVLPDGTLTPCRRLAVPVGNIMKDTLRKVWATSPVLDELRDKSLYKGRCHTCKRWSRCRGCRAVAYAYSRAQGNADFLAEDPQCFID